jgi:hypothetical protein
MAVIINEFEVVVEPPATGPQQSASANETTEEGKPRVLSPYELKVLLDHQAERTLRLSAY